MQANAAKKIFDKPPLIAYRRNRNLNDLLVSRRLPPDTEIKRSDVEQVDRNSVVCENVDGVSTPQKAS